MTQIRLPAKKDHKTMRLHQIPLIRMWAFQILFLTLLVVNANGNDTTYNLLWIPCLHFIFGVPVIYMGYVHQTFRFNKAIINRAPILWSGLFTIAYTVGTAFLYWDETVQLIEFYPQWVFFTLQAMRFLAYKSLVKYYEGVFPFAFAWGTAFPDFLFGVSALVMSLSGTELSMEKLASWNMIGFLIIVPFGLMVQQMGMQHMGIFEPKVPHEVVFNFPMAMAPILVVPMLVSWNMIVATWALAKN